MECTVCGKQLVGSIDTFGEIGSELCHEHFLEQLNEKPEPIHLTLHMRGDDDDEDDVLSDIEDDITSLEGEIEELEDELERRQDDLARAQAKQWKLTGKPVEDAKKRLSRWIETVAS